MGNETAFIEGLASLLAPVMDRQKAMRYGTGFKHDTAGTPTSSGYMHGPGGLLTFPGVDPTVFHTILQNQGILGTLQATPNVYTNPTYLTLTGVDSDIGSEKEDVCDDPPTAGLVSGCMLTSVFGRYERSTPELELNRLGQRNNRADPLDLTLVGSPISGSGPFNIGQFDPSAPGDVLTNEISTRFWERNISFARLLAKQLWNGNPTNNSGGGGYKEMTGLSVLINTGHTDAETGAACATLDSYIKNYNYKSVDDANNGVDIVATFTNMYHQLYRRAEKAGFLPVRWVVAMRPELFYELTSIWPCSYLSYRCAAVLSAANPSATGPMQGVIDAQDAVRFRDEMRSGRYLLVDGQRLDVVLDDAIPELSGNNSGGNFPAGCFSSDIYFIPMSVVGGRSVTYMEYFDFNNPSIRSAFSEGMPLIGRVEGPFITTMSQKMWCVKWTSKIEPRLIMRTPQLAGRLQHVVYCPIDHEPEAFPDDPYYFGGGGVTHRTGPSLYDIWKS
jgi:hypothetical protein